MGWVSRLQRVAVGLDTAPLIYYIEAHPVRRFVRVPGRV